MSKEVDTFTNISNERESIFKDPSDITRIMRILQKNVCHKFNHVAEMNQFLKRYKLPKFIQKETDNLKIYMD